MGKKTITMCCSRQGCSNRADGKIYTRDDVSCLGRFCCPCWTVCSVDGCGGSTVATWIMECVLTGFGGKIYTFLIWEPKADVVQNQQPQVIVVNNGNGNPYGSAIPQHVHHHHAPRPAMPSHVHHHHPSAPQHTTVHHHSP